MMRENFNQTLFQFISETHKITHDLAKDHKPEGITSPQYNLLEHLYFKEGINISEISKSMSLATSSVSREANKLIDKGYVYKVKDNEDKRKYNIFLTKEGKILLDECFFQVVKGINKKYEHLEEQELKYLVECMEYIIKKMYI